MQYLGRKYMVKNARDFMPVFEHRIMTFLTPTLKKLNFISPSKRRELHNEIEAYVSQHYPDDESSDNEQNSQQNVEQNDQNNNDNATVSNEQTGSSFLDAFISFDDSNEILRKDSEVERYIKHPITRCDTDSVKWWIEHSKMYPKLYKIFKNFSCVPATSAGSERSFSLTGNIVTDKRSVLLPSNVNSIVVVRNNL